MKVIYCLNHFLPLHVAGTEIYTFSLIKQMQQRGIICLVLIPNYESTGNNIYYYEGIQVVKYAEPSIIDRSLNMGMRPPDGIGAFRKVLETEQPDVVHFQELAGGNGMSIHHLKAAKALGAIVTITFHLAGYSCRTGDLMYKSSEHCDGVIDEKKCSLCYIHKRGYEKYSSIIWTISEQLYRLNWDTSETHSRIGTAFSIPFLIRKLRENLLEISNTCDKLIVLTAWYHRMLLKNAIPEKKMRVILQGLPLKDNKSGAPRGFDGYPVRLMFIGRISHYKGIHLLIEACRNIDPLKLSVHIYGSTMDAQYEEHCKIASVSLPNVKWMGKLKQTEVISTMQQYHGLCLPSTFSEMSPLVIQEAFSAGIPVVASNIYGNAEQVQHLYNGLLFEFNNVEALETELKRIIDNPQLLTQLRENIKSPKSFKEVGEEYLQLYEELLSDKQTKNSVLTG